MHSRIHNAASEIAGKLRGFTEKRAPAHNLALYIIAIENERADASLDDVGVELDAAVVEETREAVPMVQAVTKVQDPRPSLVVAS